MVRIDREIPARGSLRWLPVHRGSDRRRYGVQLLLFSALGWLSASISNAQVVRNETSQTRATERVVHRFDFDERAEGNLEDVPKFWEIFRPPAFPHYVDGSFDFDVGHLAAPSFHLSSEGRNVAFQYVGPDTRVRENSEYRIEGWIKPDRLRYARACLSAYYIDRFDRIILRTMVRTPYVDGDSESWRRVSVHLSPAPGDALSVGVIVWVVQQSIWDASIRPAHFVPRRDVFGGAWFDDLTVYRLPRVDLSSSDDGNVLADDNPRNLLVTLADHDDPSISGSLSIRDAAGSLVEAHEFPVVLGSDSEPHTLSVDHYEPGLYHAELIVVAHGEKLLTRTLDFAVLAPRLRPKERVARSFGMALNPSARSEPEIEGILLLRQGAQTVSIPVWTGRAERSPDPAYRRRLDRMFQELVRNNFSLGAVLHGAPGAIIQSAGAYAPSLTDLLSTGPDAWEHHLSVVAAPYAGLFRWWQVGADGDGSILSAERRKDVFENVRTALRTYITNPVLAAPANATSTPALDVKPIEQTTITIGPNIPASAFGSVLAGWRTAGFGGVSARIDAGESSDFERLPRLADWARRVILARHAGARTVFTAQTWRHRDTPRGSVTEPDERFVLLRTMADVIGDAIPGPKLSVGQNVRCVSFRESDRSVLAFWREGGSESVMRVPVQLGEARRQINLWGVSTPLEKDAMGRHVVIVSSVPVLVDGAENWLVDLMSSLSVTPARIQSGDESARLTFDWAYRGSRNVAGHVEYGVPAGWQPVPGENDFRLVTNRIERMETTVRLSPTESAGTKNLRAIVRLSEPAYYLEIPLQVHVGIEGLDVWGSAYVDGDQLLMRHTMTNRSNETVSFRSAASVPGRERQYRPFTDLKPGDTQTTLYRFEHGRELIGRRVSLVLREVNDGKRTLTLEREVP